MPAVDRSATPWIIVIVHTPLYNNYVSHFKEGDTFRTVYEPIFLQYQVDLVYSGHVHAYERTHPVYNYERNDCAPMYVTVGESMECATLVCCCCHMGRCITCFACNAGCPAFDARPLHCMQVMAAT